MSNIVTIKPLEGSSTIAGYGYDPSSQTLAVQFHDPKSPLGTRTYHVPNFPQEDAEKFETAESKGAHYHAYIRNQFAAVRVDDPSAVA